MKKIFFIFFIFLFVIRVYAQESTVPQDAADSTLSIFDVERPVDKITFVNTSEMNDFENVFTHQEEMELKNLIYTRKENLFSIVTTDSYEPYEDIKQYTFAFGESLPFNKQNLVVFALSKNKLGFFILAGQKAQVLLTPEKMKQIMDEVITPEFKEGDFFLGLKNGINAIANLAKK